MRDEGAVEGVRKPAKTTDVLGSWVIWRTSSRPVPRLAPAIR